MVRIKARIEEIVILAIVGAAVGLAVTSPLTTGAASYIPTQVESWLDAFRGLLAWVSALAGAGAGAWWAARQERDSHIRGARFFDAPKLAAPILQQEERKQFSEDQRHHKVSGIKIGGIELARSREVSHLYVVGLTGGGKTVLLNSIIDQVLARGDRLIVHDIKGDLTARYFDAETCVMLGPWDRRAAIWDAASDIDSPALADEFAAAVTGSKVIAGENAQFHLAAKYLLAGLIRSYMRDGNPWTWADLRDAMSGDPVALVQRAARGEPQVKSMFASVFPDPNSESEPYLGRGERSFVATMVAHAGWLLSYASVDATDIDRSRFSLSRWLTAKAHQETRIVFLNYRKRYAEACEHLFGALVATVSATVASDLAEVDADDNGGVWCIFDEFPQMGPGAMTETQSIAELGRSRGVRVVMALQDESQLAARLGGEKAAPVLAQQVTRVYLRSSPQTAESVCRRIGARDVDRIETTAENGAVQGKTKHAVSEQVLLPSSLMGLQVRTKGGSRGVEMILHVNDTLGLLVQPFPERREPVAEPFVASSTWRRGSLPDADASPESDRELGGDGGDLDTGDDFLPLPDFD